MHDEKGTALDGFNPASVASAALEYSGILSLPALSSYRRVSLNTNA